MCGLCFPRFRQRPVILPDNACPTSFRTVERKARAIARRRKAAGEPRHADDAIRIAPVSHADHKPARTRIDRQPLWLPNVQAIVAGPTCAGPAGTLALRVHDDHAKARSVAQIAAPMTIERSRILDEMVSGPGTFVPRSFRE